MPTTNGALLLFSIVSNLSAIKNIYYDIVICDQNKMLQEYN